MKKVKKWETEFDKLFRPLKLNKTMIATFRPYDPIPGKKNRITLGIYQLPKYIGEKHAISTLHKALSYTGKGKYHKTFRTYGRIEIYYK